MLTNLMYTSNERCVEYRERCPYTGVSRTTGRRTYGDMEKTVYQDPIPNIRWRIEGEAIWRPPTDVYETEENAIIVVEIAGLTGGDFEVDLVGRKLVVSGERRDSAEKLAIPTDGDSLRQVPHRGDFALAAGSGGPDGVL